MGKWILNGVLLVATLAAINYPALVNGFPLFYSDSGTYIAAGFGNDVPVDRTFFYPLFARHTGMGFSLWMVLLAQSLVLISVTRLLLRYLLHLQDTILPACLLLTGLGLLTGLSYNNSQLMADAFSPIMYICFGVLLVGKNIKPGHRLWLILVLIFSTAAHGSHLPVISAMAILLWAIKIIFRNKSFFIERAKNHSRVIFWGLAVWLVVSAFNYHWGIGFRPSQAGNVILMGRMMETGSAQAYLQAKCPENNNSLCVYKDSLPNNTIDFLWGTSPLYKGGCYDKGWGECWVQKNAEYGRLVKKMIAYAPARNLFIQKCINDSWLQIYSFDCVYLTPMGKGSPVYPGIEKYYSRDMEQYKNSLQYNQTLYFEKQSLIQRWVVLIGLIISTLFVVIFIRKNEFITVIVFWGMVIIGVIINATVCASLSCVADRYTTRIIWLLPLAALLMVWQWAINYKRAIKN